MALEMLQNLPADEAKNDNDGVGVHKKSSESDSKESEEIMLPRKRRATFLSAETGVTDQLVTGWSSRWAPLPCAWLIVTLGYSLPKLSIATLYS